LVEGETVLFRILLGVVICLYSASNLRSNSLSLPPKIEVWLSPIVGAVSGAITGVTGLFVMPSVAYLQSLRMPRDELIQAMGIWFTVATMSLGFSLNNHGLFPRNLALLSIIAVLPALVGMSLGRRFRARLSERTFRKTFFIALAGIGIYIIFAPH